MSNLTIHPIQEENLYEIRTYTDLAAGSILHHIPVRAQAIGLPTRDPMREERFYGSCTLFTQRGPMNVNFPIEASSLGVAISKFPDALRAHIELAEKQALRAQIANASASPIDLSKVNNKNNH